VRRLPRALRPLQGALTGRGPFPLPVEAVRPLTDEASAVHLAVPEELAATFAHEAGQHVTIVREEDGEEVRRSYSVFTPAGSGDLAIGVRHLPGGRFSSYVADGLRAGDVLQVLPPTGRFGPRIDPDAARHHAFVAAGSGITPVLSIVATVLEQEPRSRCTVLYGNRRTSTVMFLEELEDLKDRWPTRLQLVHVLSRESQPAPLLEGRLDGERLGALLDALLPPEDVDEWYLCGPFGMVHDAREALRGRGVDRGRIHRELFHADAAPVTHDAEPQTGAIVTMILDGRRSTFGVDGGSILDAALRNRPDAPYSCKGGVCGSCRCRLVEGEVTMDHRYALEDDEIEAGIVLACQSHPRSERIVLDFDAR
jgi:ring-1,2-phenylacetyl-CoA epoxidase subunit PaaE